MHILRVLEKRPPSRFRIVHPPDFGASSLRGTARNVIATGMCVNGLKLTLRDPVDGLGRPASHLFCACALAPYISSPTPNNDAHFFVQSDAAASSRPPAKRASDLPSGSSRSHLWPATLVIDLRSGKTMPKRSQSGVHTPWGRPKESGRQADAGRSYAADGWRLRYHLTQMEVAVLVEAARGCCARRGSTWSSRATIAFQLGLTAETVKSHGRNLITKTPDESIADAGLRLLRGLVDCLSTPKRACRSVSNPRTRGYTRKRKRATVGELAGEPCGRRDRQ